MGLGNAVRRYSKGIVPLLHQFAGGGFKGTAPAIVAGPSSGGYSLSPRVSWL